MNDSDRARARRVVAINAAVCLASVVGSLFASRPWVFWLVATVLPFVPITWLVIELVGLLRTLPKADVPGRCVVPLTDHPSVTSYLSAPLQLAQLALLVLPATIFVWLLDRLPAKIPAHWNARGEVDRLGSPHELWLFAVWLLIDVGIVWVVAAAVAKERWALPPGDEERYVELQRQRRSLIVRLVEWMVFGVNLSVALTWVGMAAGSLDGYGALRGWALGVSIALLAVAVIAPLAVYLRPLTRVQDDIRTLAGSDVLGTRPEGWRAGGLIYYAPEDPALFVPKKLGIGQTLNFGRPGAWIFIGSLTVLPLLITIVLIAVLH